MCIENQLKELKEQIKQLSDSNEKTVIAVRDSVPPSISDVLTTISSSINGLHKKIDAIETTLTPIARRFNDTNGFLRVFLAVAKYAGGSAAIWYIFDLILDHIKHVNH